MRILLLAFLLTAQVAYGADLPGIVVRVVDGDTIVLEVQDGRHRVRLAGIDAPEKNQPWGEAATRELRRMVAGKFIVVVGNKRDRWNRLIGTVWLAGEDVNLHMVDRGMAWHYKRYEAEQHPADRAAYTAAEDAAKADRLGLWSDPDPVPPWQWRNP
jgi:endonuclease YncB( thermonuclease family)